MSPKCFKTGLKLMMLLVFLFLTDCHKDGNTAGNASSEDHIVITPDRTNLVAKGPSAQFSARVIKASGEVFSEAVFEWHSDDPAIAFVNQDGLAKGVKVGVTRVTARSGLLSASATIGVVSPQKGASRILLSGEAAYEDKTIHQHGFTGDIVLKPVRNALIELVAIDGFKTIATSASDDFGAFEITADNSEQRGGLYIRVMSISEPDHLSKIEIRNNPRDQALYAIVSEDMDDSLNNPYMASPALIAKTQGSGGAFNLFDVFLEASEFVRQAAPCPLPNTDCLLPTLTSYWEKKSDEGTFFVSPTNEIFVLGSGKNGDADEYDDAVVIHEFGHFVLQQFSKDDSPGGRHILSENDQDIRLSWSEGWATFFSSAVRGTPLYVDTLPGGTLLSFDIEHYRTTPEASLNVFARYTTSEIAVAGVLWDLFDPIKPSDDKDLLALGFDPIWQTLIHFPSSSPATMETFWLQFKNNAATASFSDDMQAILRGRKIELFADQGPVKSLEKGPQHHTIYKGGSASNPEGDEDIISFEVYKGIRYTIQTFNLTNGADTLLTIREENGSLVAQNDNASGLIHANCSSTCPPNGKTDLASSVSFVWNGEDDVHLKAHIERSSIVPPSAGRFGAYNIKIEQTE